jgi:hypothetical protein
MPKKLNKIEKNIMKITKKKFQNNEKNINNKKKTKY